MEDIFIVKLGESHGYTEQDFQEIGDFIKVKDWLKDGSLKEGDIILKCTPVFKVERGELNLKSLNDEL